MKIRQIRYLCAIAAFLSVSVASADMDYLAAVEGKLTTQCSLEPNSCDAIVAAFNKAVTTKTGKSFKASVVRLSTSESITRLTSELASSRKAAKRKCKGLSGEPFDNCLEGLYKTKVDVLFGGTDGPYRAALESNLFAKNDYPVSNVYPWAVQLTRESDSRLGALYMGILGVGYNPDLLSKLKLPTPAGWADLAKPEYKGVIGVANANTSGTSYKYLSSMLVAFGSEEEGWKRIMANHKNIGQYTKSGSAPCRMVGRGELPVCIGFLAVIAELNHTGLPIVGVAPQEGTLYEIGPIGIVTGSKNRSNAEAFARFLYEPMVQKVLEANGSRQFHSNIESAVPVGAPDTVAIKLLDSDPKFGTQTFKNEVIGRWNDEIFPVKR